MIKSIKNFFKKNPVFAISITLGLLILIVRKWTTIVDTTKGLITTMQDYFQHPIGIPTYVTSKFGERIHPVTKKKSFHNGIDLHAPTGTPLFAPADGVASTSISPEGGNQLVITHTNGYKTGYAHLKSRAVGHQEKVKKGQLIAYSGNTGLHTTAPHLHFTVTNPEGRKVDPLSFFKFPLKA
jgi:murein DD-endopeptidase MepM/ murein hydrolase activator NlpD